MALLVSRRETKDTCCRNSLHSSRHKPLLNAGALCYSFFADGCKLSVLAGMNEELFDAGWRNACHLEACSIKDVDAFIKAHYLKKRPAIVLLCLAIKCKNEIMGCIVYSAPPKQTEVRYGGVTWELARLYVLDCVPKNAESWAISKSVKYIKKNYTNVRYLVSYADPSAGHTGAIYLASNWIRDGRTDQERKSPRCDYVDMRTGKKYGRRANMPKDAVVGRVPRVSKWRYVCKL